METRQRAHKSLSPSVSAERLFTKKEIEEQPAKFKTCPPVAKKHQGASDYLKQRIYAKGKGNAKIVYFNKPTELSKLYNPFVKSTYLCQLYRISTCIGEGSFGVVYKARNREDGHLYAIKLMKKYTVEAANYGEVRRLEKIGEHENLVKFYLAWEEQSIVYMQLELCALSLATYTKTNHSITLEQLWDIFIDMLNALKHMHSRGLVHLDIKPDNIMISAGGMYKLGDFGLLLDLNERRTQSRAVKSAQTSEGDAKYLAKEVLEGVYTRAADIFSLGISLLELGADLILPGNGPLWHQLRDGTFKSQYFKMVPYKIRSTITKMMIPNPNRRPTVDEIFDFGNVKRAFLQREGNQRVNYYEIWRAHNVEESDVRPIAVCLNPKERRTPTDFLDDDLEDEQDMDLEDDDDMGVEPLDTSTCVTPPKCVSQVILYSI